MRLAGLKPRLLNIGGGFPVRHVKPIPSIEKIAEVVNHALRDVPQGVRVMAEPGRYFVSDAGYFVCRVVGTAPRAGKRWMYWDAGVFGGVIETTEGLRYDVQTDRTGKLIPWNIAGPTCDSVDVCMRDELFPPAPPPAPATSTASRCPGGAALAPPLRGTVTPNASSSPQIFSRSGGGLGW